MKDLYEILNKYNKFILVYVWITNYIRISCQLLSVF